MKPYVLWTLGIAVSLILLTSTVSGASTELHITLYAADGYTVLNETRVDYRWMEQHLPVRGDGTTHYYAQGPVFVDDAEERWNPEEDANVLDKDMGAIKGTDLRDLCELVGGMEPGDTVTLKAADGFSKTFAYENAYEPPGRQGAMVIAWYHANQSYVPTYADGMRLVFLADTSTNPWGVHAFGNYDWHESAEEEYWYYYYQEGQQYPTTTGLSVKYISEIEIWSSREPQGAIAITSNHPGARVWLDGVDSGYDTPCSLGELSEGYYSLTVKKNDYITPEEQDVEVVAGKTVPVSFDLEPAAQDGGGSGSGDGGGGAISPDSSGAQFAGGLLVEAEQLHGNGSFVLLPSKTPLFTLKGGEKHLLGFDTSITSPDPRQIRLYLFLEESTADPGVDTTPQLLISSGNEEIAPVRSYSEEGEDDHLYATTLVYSLQGWNESGIITLSSRNHGSWNSTVAGSLAFMEYDQPGGAETWVWIGEGADLIGAIPGEEPPMTMAEFYNGIPEATGGNVTILAGTTSALAAENLSFYINGIGAPARMISGKSPVVVHEISEVRVPGSKGIRVHIGADEMLVTNRIVVLLIKGEPLYNDTSVPSQTPVVPLITTGVPVTSLPDTSPGDTLPRETERNRDPIGNLLCWLLNLMLMLGGQPPEPCYQGRDVIPEPTASSEETGEVGGAAKIGVSSSPDGARVFLDTIDTGLVTPCGIDVVAGEMHAIRVTKDGYLPLEQQVAGPADLEFLLVPVLPPTPVKESLLPATPTSHHGGVYISSYPEKAEIRIDGVVVGASSPVLVTPLREGFHTITAGIPAGTNSYSVRQTVRTWIFPDAIVPVEFNLMETIATSSLSITSDSRRGASFTVNGYFPVKRIPDRIEVIGNPSFITLTDGSSYLSFSVPADSRENGEFSIPREDPSVCNLSVTSTPGGAEVFLDGIRTGLLTPTVIPNVSAGYHRVSLSLKGRLPVTERIFIPESQCVVGGSSVHYPLPWYPSGNLQLITSPPGATVSFRGLKTGEVTPCTLEGIPIGSWEVILTQDKTKKGIDATVEPGRTRTYSVVFEG